MEKQSVLVWLRRDLRINDNPALHAACATDRPVVVFYVLDETGQDAPGAAAKWWLHHSLQSLSERLGALGSKLILRRGESTETVKSLVAACDATAVFWNRRYTPDGIDADRNLKADLTSDGIEVNSFNGSLLKEPWELKTGSGGHYRVFSPFWRALQKEGPTRTEPASPPNEICAPNRFPESDTLSDWNLLPTRPNWAARFSDVWTPGEDGALQRLDAFLTSGVSNYDEDRNRPDIGSTSRLSPHLAFGEISPLLIWNKTQAKIASNDVSEEQGLKFLSEIVWREFAYVLLYHYKSVKTDPIREEFNRFPWADDEENLIAWRKGLTGYPIVDAGMRELWQTGWMHNRVRMITASFLIKHLLLPWQRGEEWFWDTLTDADPGNNPVSWQWVAGCGADAAPYFRIFNPITQGEKFDPNGSYTKQYVPELEGLPAKYLQKPWEAPVEVLEKAGVVLGETYPRPIVDHAVARERALSAFDSIKKS